MLADSPSPNPQIAAEVDLAGPRRSAIRALVTRFFGRTGSSRKFTPDVFSKPEPYVLVEHGCQTRRTAERFIAQRFAEAFDAQIDAFMPRLFTVERPDGFVGGAFGLRSTRHRLFVEHYLDVSIEQAIAMRTGALVDRRSIVEIGHFSGAAPGAMRALILLLIERLHREGFAWVAFTGTTQLRNAFRRMGLFPIDIAAATAESIPAESLPAWGRYYDNAPRVLVGRICDGLPALTKALEADVANAAGDFA